MCRKLLQYEVAVTLPVQRVQLFQHLVFLLCPDTAFYVTERFLIIVAFTGFNWVRQNCLHILPVNLSTNSVARRIFKKYFFLLLRPVHTLNNLLQISSLLLCYFKISYFLLAHQRGPVWDVFPHICPVNVDLAIFPNHLIFFILRKLI